VRTGSKNLQPQMSVRDRELEELLRNASRFLSGSGPFSRAPRREVIKASERELETHGEDAKS
jgi:hypothetical protein